MLFEIDPKSPVPIYSQIASCVRRALADATLLPGTRLPASRDLARELDVNMHTVQRAYSQLRDEGLLELRQGRGAIATKGSVVHSVRLTALLHDLLDEAASQGITRGELVKLVEESR